MFTFIFSQHRSTQIHGHTTTLQPNLWFQQPWAQAESSECHRVQTGAIINSSNRYSTLKSHFHKLALVQVEYAIEKASITPAQDAELQL